MFNARSDTSAIIGGARSDIFWHQFCNFFPAMLTKTQHILAGLILTFSATTHAKGLIIRRSCPEAFAEASQKYVETIEAGENASAFKLCASAALPDLMPCLAGALGLSENGNQIGKLQQIHKLNLVYQNIKSGTVKESEEVQELIHELGVDASHAEEALAKVAWLIESGSLCKRGQARAGFAEAVEALRPEGSSAF